MDDVVIVTIAVTVNAAHSSLAWHGHCANGLAIHTAETFHPTTYVSVDIRDRRSYLHAVIGLQHPEHPREEL